MQSQKILSTIQIVPMYPFKSDISQHDRVLSYWAIERQKLADAEAKIETLEKSLASLG
mgnify:CR=1 FL=1